MSEATPPRKYFTETALNLHTSTVIMIPPDQLHRDAAPPEGFIDAVADCHIYLICRRPRLSYDPSTFKFNLPESTGHFLRRINGKEERIGFRKKIGIPNGAAIEVGPYPHREILIKSKDEEDRIIPANVMVHQMHVTDDAVRDLEVIYVGQAFGDGNRNALDRLRSHATLQQILAEQAAQRPDDEIMLLLFKYEMQFFTSMDGITKSGISDERDTEHFLNIVDNPPTEKQQIAIAEAGLIRYFAPDYNEKYKNSFPHDQLKILEDCYKLDFAGLVVEINTEDVLAPLWSPNTKGKGVHHIAQFDLHDLKVRRSFFSFVDRDGRYALMNSSGPVF